MLPMIMDRRFLGRLFRDVSGSRGARMGMSLPGRAIAGLTANGDRRFRVGNCGGRYLRGNLSSISFLIRGHSGIRT